MPETAFLGAQIAPKSLSAGASSQTPLGELAALPQTLYLDSRGPTPKAPKPAIVTVDVYYLCYVLGK